MNQSVATPLIRGSLAVDTILLHRGAFSTRILPHEIGRLNVSFGIEEARDEYGGTAGNIAYGCQLLGDRPLLNASLGGVDGAPWLSRVSSWGLSDSAILIVDGARSARAYIITDELNNQITAFQSGALRHVAPLPESGFDFAWLAPDSSLSMVGACKNLAARGIPYVLDPGQSLPSLLEGQSGANFAAMLAGAGALFVNDYEAELCVNALGLSFDAIARSMPVCVRTLGAEGCELWEQGANPIRVPVATPKQVEDPTGCGDAFRSGFIHGKCRGWSAANCAKLGSVMGSFAIEHFGGQNHTPSFLDINERFQAHFGAWPKARAPGPKL